MRRVGQRHEHRHVRQKRPENMIVLTDIDQGWSFLCTLPLVARQEVFFRIFVVGGFGGLVLHFCGLYSKLASHV